MLSPPPAPRYALYRGTEAWLAVSLSPPVLEAHNLEAYRHFHARLLRALCPVWPIAVVQHAPDKNGIHLSGRQFQLLPGGGA